MMWQTGMKLTPSRFKRIYFPAHVQAGITVLGGAPKAIETIGKW